MEKIISITEQHTQEELNRACIRAIAGKAGYNTAYPQSDYGIDGYFREVGIRDNRRIETGLSLDYQLKATTQWSEDNDEIVYALESKTYNDLADTNVRVSPLLLILFCMPKNRDEWVTCTYENLILKNCCFWYFVSGDQTTNTYKKTIRIPKDQLLTPDALSAIMEKVKEGDDLAPESRSIFLVRNWFIKSL